MNLRAYWGFYKAIFPFIAAIALIFVVVFGVIWGFVLFATVGYCFGFIGFNSFRKQEYYFYYNLGITKWKLFKTTFIINIIAGIPAFILLLIFFLFIFGGFTIT